jgi:hypothetical protein
MSADDTKYQYNQNQFAVQPELSQRGSCFAVPTVSANATTNEVDNDGLPANDCSKDKVRCVSFQAVRRFSRSTAPDNKQQTGIAEFPH